ncbi:hypothetical protein E2C01_048652 [Portunus trituberculatus]|uniref:SGNH hydrolase-type esterase domain-containing protein n=1 Tax=Portunus trituberculatus TaxID=210409 RepID=A0A5B7GBJ2_PORTR|nr:hypothetical protein [Portunus trituberculatus]
MAIALNCRLADHSRNNGWAFINNWDLFYGKDTLYARDGVHLSRQGVRVLAGTLEGELNALRRFFSVDRRNLVRYVREAI